MRVLLFFILFGFTTSALFALTPFSLYGVKKLSVHVADYSELLDGSMKTKLESMMQAKLKSIGVTEEKYYKQSFVLLLKSQSVGKSKLLNLDLMIMGDVTRSDSKEPTFGISYLHKDSVEIEDAPLDAADSLAFLLDEFVEQYREDNRE